MLLWAFSTLPGRTFQGANWAPPNFGGRIAYGAFGIVVGTPGTKSEVNIDSATPPQRTRLALTSGTHMVITKTTPRRTAKAVTTAAKSVICRLLNHKPKSLARRAAGGGRDARRTVGRRLCPAAGARKRGRLNYLPCL